jgi:hypothetical protein
MMFSLPLKVVGGLIAVVMALAVIANIIDIQVATHRIIMGLLMIVVAYLIEINDNLKSRKE